MPVRARTLAGGVAAAIAVTLVPAFAAAPDLPHRAGDRCTTEGIEATFGVAAGGTRLDHVLLRRIDDRCAGMLVTVRVGTARGEAPVAGPQLTVPMDPAIPLTEVTSIVVTVRAPARATG